MSRLSLAGRIETGIAPAEGVIGAKHLVGVSVSELQIDTRQFRSRDVTRTREGVVAVSVGGQESIFTFAGSEIIDVPCDSQIAFLGTNPGDLAISVRLVELDKAARRALERGGKIAAIAAQAVGPLSMPFAGAGLGVASAFLNVLAKLSRDDDEMAAFTLVDGPFGNGARVELRIGSGETPKLRAVFAIHDFGKRQTFKVASLRVTEPWIEFGSQRIAQRQRESAGQTTRRRTYSVREWLTRTKGLKELVFAAGSGRHRAGIVARLQGAEDIFCWHRWELFRVAAARAADRHVIPLSMGFSLNSDSEMVEAVLDLVRASADLAEEINPELKQAAQSVHKAGRGLADIVSEIGESELPLFQFDGALLLLPKEVEARPGVAEGKLELEQTDDGIWSGQVACEFRRWRKKPLGRVGFGIEVAVD